MRGKCAFSATLVSSLLWGSSLSYAAEHELKELGESVPLWYEYRAAVNDSGVVAWSKLVGGFPQATRTAASTSVSHSLHADVVAAFPEATRTLALEINQSGDVVGFRSVSNHDGNRQAQLWTASSTLIDLHTRVSAGFEMSAAYGVSDREGSKVLVVGYQREAIQTTTLSRPYYWTVDVSSGAATGAALPLSADYAYGIAYSVGEVDSTGARYACGVALRKSQPSVPNPNVQFTEAGCWKFTRANPSAAWTPAAFAPITEVRAGTDTGFATSVVSRVRTIEVSPSRYETFAVGYVVDVKGASSGFVKNLTTPGSRSFDIDFALNPSADSLISDITHMTYAKDSSSLAATTPITGQGAQQHYVAWGPLLVGSSSSVSKCDWGGSDNCERLNLPNHSQPIAVLRPVEQTRIGNTSTSARSAGVCNLQSFVPVSAGTPPQHVSSISRNARWRVAIGDKTLYALRDTTAEKFDFKVYVRDTIRYADYNTPVDVKHYWAEWEGQTQPNVRVQWSNQAGCTAVNNGAVCADFSTGMAADALVSRITGRVRVNAARPSSTYAYVQASVVSGTNCSVTPVYLASEVEVVNPSINFDTSERWLECSTQAESTHGSISGARVDVLSDARHCGNCGVGTSDGKFCTVDTCQSGAVRNTFDPALGCMISNECYAYGDYEPYQGVESPRLLENYCRECRVTNPTGWTARDQDDPCCDSSGRPRDSRWASGRRPAEKPNIFYSNHDTFTASTNEWITRLPSIKDQDSWTKQEVIRTRRIQNDDNTACRLSGNRCSVRSGFSGTCTAVGPNGSKKCNFDGYQETQGTVCNADAPATSSAKRGPRRLKSYLRSPAGSDDWYVFRITDHNDYWNMPRVRLVPENPQDKYKLCMYAYCVDSVLNREFLSSALPQFYRRTGGSRADLAMLAINDYLVEARNGVGANRRMLGACVGDINEAAGPRDIVLDMEKQNNYNIDCWNADYFIQVTRSDPNQEAGPADGCWSYDLFWGNDRTMLTNDSNGKTIDNGDAGLCDNAGIPYETSSLN